MEPIARVTISNDCDWETAFIPWLEGMEKENVGVADGVFVASIDPALWVLQPADESNFLKHCLHKKLKEVSQLRLTEYIQDGVFEFTTEPACVETFKKKISHLHSYKSDTCCTPFLEPDDGLYDALFSHLNSVIHQVKEVAHCDEGFGSTKSMVPLEEAGLKMKQLYEKYSQSTDGFGWETRQKGREDCPDLECRDIWQEEEGGSSHEIPKRDTCVGPKKANKKIKRSLNVRKICEPICYGYGYEYPSDCLKITPRLNLCRIFNILWLIPHHFPGLHSTYLYFGECHSFFPIHIEDALTLSLNYLYMGHPKVWIFVPPFATEVLEFHLHKSMTHLSHVACRNVLGHKVLFPTTSWLKARNIPFKVLVQRPGDMVVIYPNTPHAGFNTGPNIAQAINVATKSWIPYGVNARKCVCMAKPIHINMAPIVAAFRPDLLFTLMSGDVILTPALIQGTQLLRDTLVKTHVECKGEPVHKEGSVATVKCPAPLCTRTFSRTPENTVRRLMINHVKSTHKPIVEKLELCQKIDQILQK